jgi:hypothetical protein
MMSENKVQCPCGVHIEKDQYKLLYLKKDTGEIDILCPNDYCYLKELGFLKFEITEMGTVAFEIGRFYSPFVTWNATRMSEENTVKELKTHLIFITERMINWSKVVDDYQAKLKENLAKEVS